ncbi:MAG: NADPH-dependent FMN reductase [Porticoccaceae bacterium]|nr:MAG: NADPH-dependent FMN reductase [Porticoccaceae bacterium]
MNILLMSGSFHSKSKSISILNSLQSYFPNYDYELPRLDKLPFYNEDLNADKPDSILSLIDQVKTCNGIVVCSPEYNHSVPAVLKNAIDWVSRPAFNSALKDKPITIITQANSPVGGARAQAHLKLIFDSTLSVIYPSHEMMITGVDKVIASDGSISDGVKNCLERHFSSFVEFIVKHS